MIEFNYLIIFHTSLFSASVFRFYAFYIIFFCIPVFVGEIQSQCLAFLPLFWPITTFTFLDYTNNGSFGKAKAGLNWFTRKQCRLA